MSVPTNDNHPSPDRPNKDRPPEGRSKKARSNPNAGNSVSPSQDAAGIRAGAARALNRVLERHLTTDQVLERVPTSLGRDLLFGSLRYYYPLESMITAQLARPLRSKDHDLWCLMLVGAYQLTQTRIPDHAAIHATVQACQPLGKPWARKLVNGILRSVQRSRERAFGVVDYYPRWLADMITADYPTDGEAILNACLGRAPQSLRVNVQLIATSQYADQLASSGIASEAGFIPSQLILKVPVTIDTLPGFHQGLVTVQDAGAGFAPQLLKLQPGQRFLDTCAAPGGKLLHLLAEAPDIAQGVALELSPNRSQHLRDECKRLQCAPVIIEADATNLDWWDGELFDAALVDAPCTGTGTMRRHPELKLLRQANDVGAFQALQLALLESSWQTLRPGGSLLYCTCSLLIAENDHVINSFLTHTPDARTQAISLPTGAATTFGWQLTPTDPRTDGFYYSLLHKTNHAGP